MADIGLPQATSIKYVPAKSRVELGRKAGTEVKTDQQCL
jgi:hypothetical protein